MHGAGNNIKAHRVTGHWNSLNMNQDSIINMKTISKLSYNIDTGSIPDSFFVSSIVSTSVPHSAMQQNSNEMAQNAPLSPLKERHKIWHVTQLKSIFRPQKRWTRNRRHVYGGKKERVDLPNVGRGWSPSRSSLPRCRMRSCFSHSFISFSSFMMMLNVSSFL